ncbi:MAG TPA: hypothetical protein VK158_02180 [Acidobacteriota bacterium]|nr:hypothetical protein [Acidobacteriota bacterium]
MALEFRIITRPEDMNANLLQKMQQYLPQQNERIQISLRYFVMGGGIFVGDMFYHSLGQPEPLRSISFLKIHERMKHMTAEYDIEMLHPKSPTLLYTTDLHIGDLHIGIRCVRNLDDDLKRLSDCYATLKTEIATHNKKFSGSR